MVQMPLPTSLCFRRRHSCTVPHRNVIVMPTFDAFLAQKKLLKYFSSLKRKLSMIVVLHALL